MKITTYPAAVIVCAAWSLGPAWAAPPLSAQDQSFVSQAAVGGLAEVEEGQLALAQAKAATVKQFGQHMIDDHTPNNQQLISLAKQKGISPPAVLDPEHAQQAAMLKKQSGAAFDTAYINGQIAGHQKMATVMQTEIQSGTDPDLKAFAQTTLPVVQEHLQMAQALQTKG